MNRYSLRHPIFCIGHNKTGTTSLAHLLASGGYRMAPQRIGEALLPAWYAGDNHSIIAWIQTSKSQFYQDVPFSYPNTYKWLVEAFPKAYFIHTIRNSAEEWLDSRMRFDKKIVGSEGNPTWKQLEEFQVGGLPRGSLARFRKEIIGLNEDPNERTSMLEFYNQYNQEIIEFFSNPDNGKFKFISLQINDPDFAIKLNAFLKPIVPLGPLPHSNKSA